MKRLLFVLDRWPINAGVSDAGPVLMLVSTTCMGVATAGGHYNPILQSQTPGTGTDVRFLYSPQLSERLFW